MSLGISAGFNKSGENGVRGITQGLHNSGRQSEPSVSTRKQSEWDFM